MKKLIFGGMLFICGFIGIMIIVAIYAFYPYSLESTGSLFFEFLRNSHTAIPFLLCCILCGGGGIISWKAAYIGKEKANLNE